MCSIMHLTVQAVIWALTLMKFELSKARLVSLVMRDGSFVFGALLGARSPPPHDVRLTLAFASTVDGNPHLEHFEESRL